MRFVFKLMAVFWGAFVESVCYTDYIQYKNAHDEYATFQNNKFSVYSKSEFKNKFMGLKTHKQKLTKMYYERYDENTPPSIDWTKLGAVTNVKDRGECGSCWAFSATGDMEGTAFTKFGVKRNLSEQQLVDCVTADQKCQGGLPSDAFEYVIHNGIQKESEYKYTGESDTCRFKKDIEVFKIDSWVTLSTNESLIASYVAKNGPVSIGINADLFQFYQRDHNKCDRMYW